MRSESGFVLMLCNAKMTAYPIDGMLVFVEIGVAIKALTQLQKILQNRLSTSMMLHNIGNNKFVLTYSALL